MNKALVSIGIPVYNDETWVSKTLKSVINQDYNNLEIIVVDDFSNDKTREICKSFQTTDHRIIFHENPFTIGAIENHKLVFNLSHGEYFIWCNGHDYFDPSYISKCVESLEQDKSLQLCCGKTDLISMDGVTFKTLFQSLDTRGMSAVDRFHAVYWASTKNACIFYGVFRSESIKNANPFRKTLGGDLIFLAEVSLKGNFLQRDDITFYRQRVRPELTVEQATQRWIENIVQPEGHRLEAVTPWLNMAYEYLNMIVNLRRPATEQEVLLSTAIDLVKIIYGDRIQSDIEKLISINVEEITGPFNRNTYLTELIPNLIKAKFFYRDISKLDNMLHKCIGMTGQVDSLMSVPYRPMSIVTDLTKMKLPKMAIEQYNKSQEYITSGNFNEAINELEVLIDGYPDFAIAYNDLGVIYYNKGDKERALKYYEKAVALNPENINFQKNLADFYFVELGHTEDAIRIYLKVLATHPEDIEALLTIGNFCVTVEKIEQAKVFFNRVLKINPINAEAMKIIDLLNKQHRAITPAQTDATTNGVECPICDGRFQAFLPFGVRPRPNALCPVCDSLERHRLLWLYLQIKTDFLKENLKVLDIAPTRVLSRKIAELPNIDYISIDLNSPLAMQFMDITSLTFPDNHFDCIFCYHVLEHIPDDNKAISELFRVLKPSGWAIIQVPVNEDIEKTLEDTKVTDPKEREKLYGQNDHVRLYGRDFKERLEKGKFYVTVDDFVSTLPLNQIKTYALDPNENIYFCRKKSKSQNLSVPDIKRNKIKVVFAVTETGEMSAAGDYFTAMELGLACREQFGWDVELVPTERWYDVADADVLVAMTHRYNLNRLVPLATSIIKICWMRNWFDGWAGQPFFHLWDIYLCSSLKALDYIKGKYHVNPHLLRLATNPKRFNPLGQERKIDYCFTGNYWNDPRDIEKINPEKIGLNFALFGKNWEQHAQFKQYYRGFIPYSDLPSIYNQAKILVDDANRVTKQWGSVNSRVFDALAAGTLVITNSMESSKDAFQGKLPVYNTPAELRKLLHLFTGDSQAYESKVNILRKMVMDYHTYEVRALEFGEILSNYGNIRQGIDTGLSKNRSLKAIPRISIIIPVFNKLDFTKKCLSALKVNTNPDIYEIIVVDNASTDGTARFLASLNSLSIKIITNEKNEGFAKACNQGAKAASTDYLLFLNNDTEPQQGWLEPLLNIISHDDSVAAVGSKLLYPDGTIQHGGILIVDDRKNNDPLLARNNHVNKPATAPEANEPATYQALTAACLLIRKAAFQKAGAFDEEYWNGYEDVDLCFTLREQGGKLVYQPESVVIHHESKSGPERFSKARENIARLHKKWLGKIKPDAVLNKDGSVAMTDAGTIQPYRALEWDNQPLVTAPAAIKPNITSIVILTFNQLKYTKECVESISKHTPEPHEIIFVDNGSTDGTVKWLKKLVEENPSYRRIENGTNLGFARGCNQGITASKGEYILLLNNDVVVTENWLSGMLECLNSDPGIGIVGPMTNNISGTQKDSNATYKTIKDMHTYAKSFREKNQHRRIPLRRIVGFCMLFRRSLVEKIGLLDDSFGTGNFEDDDYCLRSSLAGYRNIIAGDVFIHHYGSRSFIGNRIDYGSAMAGNRKIFNEKWSGINSQSELGQKLVITSALENATELHERGMTDKAVERLIEGIKYSPENKAIYYALAMILIDAKRYQDAFDALNSLPEEAKNDAKSLELIGYCKEGIAHYEEAEEYADKALSMNSTRAPALNLRGILAYRQGDRKTAEDLFKRAIASDPGYGEPYTNLGVLSWAEGNKDEALNMLERGFILSPAIMDIATTYHSAITGMNEFGRAERVFHEAQALYPLRRRIAFLLIDVLLQQGKNKEAMQEIEEAMVSFGIDDDLLSAALAVRDKVGSKEINKTLKNRGTLSLCMIVKNEEQHIAKCLMSVKPVVDEMIVADTGSTDRTKEIAKALGAKVYDFEWTGDFSEARNYSLSKASGKWILVLDADEVISLLDHEKIRTIADNNEDKKMARQFTTRNYVDFVGIHSWRKNDDFYNEQAGVGWIASRKVRFFPRNDKIYFVNPVHEILEPSIEKLSMEIVECDVPIHHYGKLDKDKGKKKGSIYLELGEKKLAESGGGDPKALWELGIQNFVNGNYQDALERFREIIALEPELLQAGTELSKVHMQVGICYMCLHNYSDALASLGKSIELAPDLKEANLNYAVTLIFLGRAAEAIISIETFCRMDPNHLHGKYILAIAQFCAGKKEEGFSTVSSLNGSMMPFMQFVALFVKDLKLSGQSDYIPAILRPLEELNSITPELSVMLKECCREEKSKGVIDEKSINVFEKPCEDTNQDKHRIDSDEGIKTFTQKEAKTGLTSIVILTFNQLKYTQECVDSIRRYTPEIHEIIFVDNGSTDRTVKWLRELINENPNYKLIENEKDLGFAKGCNQGISASSGEYILLMNNEVVVTEGWLSGMLECLNSALDIGIVGPMTNNISGPQKVADAGYKAMHKMHEYARLFRERHRHRRISLKRIARFCMLFRRELVKKIGMLDESFGSINFEDDDFCLRAIIEGYRNLVAGDVFIHYHGSRSFIGNRIDYSAAMSGNRKIFNEKWNGIDRNSALGKALVMVTALEQADELKQQGLVNEAVKVLIDSISFAPDDKRSYLNLAELLIEDKRFTDALEALQNLPVGSEVDARVMELTGYCKEGMKLYDEAMACAENALAINPHSASALNLRGVLAIRKGDKSTAEDFFKKAIDSDPGYGEPYTNLGVMKWVEGKREKGFELLERGFMLAPSIADIVTTYHSAVSEMKAFERAERAFREAKELYPQNKRIIFLLIDIFLQQDRFENAMQEIEHAMIVFGIDDGMLSASLDIRGKMGPKEIKETIKKKGTLSLSMIVKNEEQHIAKCLMSVKPVVDEIIVVDTGSTDRTKEIALVFGAKVYDFEWAEDFSAARNYALEKASGQWILSLDADEVISPSDYASLSALIKKDHSRPTAYSFITRNYSNEIVSQGWTPNDGRYPNEEAAAGWFPSEKVRLFFNDKRIRFENPVHEFVEGSVQRAGMAIKPCSIPVHHYGRLNIEKVAAKGEAYYILGKKKLVEKGNDLKALFELGVQAGELKKYKEAAELFQKVVDIDPKYPYALFNLGFNCMELGRYNDAFAFTKKAYEFDPKHKETAINLAYCELVVGDIKNATALLEVTVRRVSEYPPAMGTLAAAYYINGKKEEALTILEKLNRKGFDCSVCLYDIASGLFSTGRLKQAMDVLEAAVQSKNIHKDTGDLLQKCYRAIINGERNPDSK